MQQKKEENVKQKNNCSIVRVLSIDLNKFISILHMQQ